MGEIPSGSPEHKFAGLEFSPEGVEELFELAVTEALASGHRSGVDWYNALPKDDRVKMDIHVAKAAAYKDALNKVCPEQDWNQKVDEEADRILA